MFDFERYSILVVDDDERILSLLVQILKNYGFNAFGARNTNEARVVMSSHGTSFDILIVDCMMPKESGIEFIRSIRESDSNINQKTPAILLTAVDSIDNKLLGFENGIDDYITKPFDERELVARIKTIIKRTDNNKNNDKKIIYFGDCSFDIENGNLMRNNENIYLSSTELLLLKTLCQRPNQPISREDLSQKLGFIVSDRTIDVQITRLRRKIGDNSKQPSIIQTVRYIGYSIKIQ